MMDITIKKIEHVTEAHYELLLEADPSRELIDNYIARSTAFEAVSDDKCVGVMVLLPTRPEMVEIVNIAVAEAQRGKGIATRMIQFALEFARKANYKTIEIGTGSTGFEQLYLYQKCGFRMTWIDRDFFTRYHDEEIIDNGFLLQDMVRLSQDLR